MSTAFSTFHSIVKRLGKLKPTRQAIPEGQVLQMEAARSVRSSQHSGARAASKGRRFQVKWQLHMDVAQTPSNLM